MRPITCTVLTPWVNTVLVIGPVIYIAAFNGDVIAIGGGGVNAGPSAA